MKQIWTILHWCLLWECATLLICDRIKMTVKLATRHISMEHFEQQGEKETMEAFLNRIMAAVSLTMQS